MKSNVKRILTTAVVTFTIMGLSACALPAAEQAYWQRVEENSALWMTGPKAQQQLEQDMASCVRQVDELVELGALRKTTPPDTHSEYHRALDASGHLKFFDTPTRHGDHKVSHTDFHDFESCMRYAGWERVNFVRYQTAQQSHKVYKQTQDLRLWGVTHESTVIERDAQTAVVNGDYAGVNQ